MRVQSPEKTVIKMINTGPYFLNPAFSGKQQASDGAE